MGETLWNWRVFLTIIRYSAADILKQRTTDVDVKKYAVKLMQVTRSFEYTLDYLEKVEKRARDAIRELGGNLELEKVLDYLVTGKM